MPEAHLRALQVCWKSLLHTDAVQTRLSLWWWYVFFFVICSTLWHC